MARRGRPRAFDREAALRSALELFRAVGYDGATLEELLTVMGGIAPPSFYAAFGSKEQLFKEAVELYRATVGGEPARALFGGSTAHVAIEAMLRTAVGSFCTPGEARGCLLMSGAMSCAPASRGVQEHLRHLRRQAPELIRQRVERGVAERDLPPGVDPGALTAFYATVLNGLAIRAHDGASREELDAAVDGAMAAWGTLTGAP